MIYFEQYYIQWKSAAQVGKGSTNALLEIRRIRENEEERVAERNWQTVEAGEKKKSAKEIYARISNGTPAFFPFPGSQKRPN